ncbi:hypothetical protein BD779DRAFT_1677189 [Infundibulicybe gibba]|nr:hypothetical protein BD779DRAFT_1677189 [Infundibulicybe gibba]
MTLLIRSPTTQSQTPPALTSYMKPSPPSTTPTPVFLPCFVPHLFPRNQKRASRSPRRRGATTLCQSPIARDAVQQGWDESMKAWDEAWKEREAGWWKSFDEAWNEQEEVWRKALDEARMEQGEVWWEALDERWAREERLRMEKWDRDEKLDISAHLPPPPGPTPLPSKKDAAHRPHRRRKIVRPRSPIALDAVEQERAAQHKEWEKAWDENQDKWRNAQDENRKVWDEWLDKWLDERERMPKDEWEKARRGVWTALEERQAREEELAAKRTARSDELRAERRARRKRRNAEEWARAKKELAELRALRERLLDGKRGSRRAASKAEPARTKRPQSQDRASQEAPVNVGLLEATPTQEIAVELINDPHPLQAEEGKAPLSGIIDEGDG